jgi:two-component system chemotaxis sensor kinase CheA
MDKDQEFQKKLLSMFKVEAGEHVQALSSGLIQLERTTGPEQRMVAIESVFREAHSLKGAARAVNVADIETLCQRVESVFSALKRKEAELSPALLDILHDAVDTLGKLLSFIGLDAAAKSSPSIADLLRRLDRAVVGAGAPRSMKTATKSPALPQPVHETSQALPEEKPVLADTVRITTARLDALLFQAEGLLAAKLTAAQRAAEIRETMVAFAELKKERAKIISGMKAVRNGKADKGNGAGSDGARQNGPNRADPRLRKLLELIAWEGNFVKSFDTRLGALAGAAEHDHRALSLMVDGLLEDTKKALMLPVSSVLEVLPKSVRDLARAQGKQVDLIARGGDIEIDRRILEQMRDPLIHLVRNCVDHGIETPEQRKLKNKPPRGTISLAVTHKDGSRIEILVADDGVGVDLARVEGAARKLGLVSPEGGASAGRVERLLLIFQSGVSTSPIITDISGRGLGLAIVREKVEKLGGVISVETDRDLGTTFRVVLPLTLATLRGVHVRVHDQLFVLPTTHVEQAIRLRQTVVKTVENRETIEWNGQAIALVRLADVLELPSGPAGASSTDSVQALILGSAHKRIAFRVDEIVGEQEILVKSLGKQLSRVRNIAGATVLGTGKAVPILDVQDLLRSAVRAATASVATAPDKRKVAAERKAILVAEDSITSRTLLKNILESAGYKVSTAVDGIDAFSLLKIDRFDLVVSDVEMPRMSGFDLTAKIRADKALAELPVVLVTALGSQEHRERGVDVGANAYIVKSSFDQSNLLEVVRRLL